jgi:hypothetical protein
MEKELCAFHIDKVRLVFYYPGGLLWTEVEQ